LTKKGKKKGKRKNKEKKLLLLNGSLQLKEYTIAMTFETRAHMHPKGICSDWGRRGQGKKKGKGGKQFK